MADKYKRAATSIQPPDKEEWGTILRMAEQLAPPGPSHIVTPQRRRRSCWKGRELGIV